MTEAAKLYLRVREKEGRLYRDAFLRGLPQVPADHPLGDEWRARQASSRRLVRYLGRLPSPLRVLDLGCGNGWLAYLLTREIGARTTGVDVNMTELAQARRVFGESEFLSWVGADISVPPFGPRSFDVVVIAAAIQYFADVPRLIESLSFLLVTAGEIHILDSPIYARDALGAARERSRKYYRKLGFPEMAMHYHHHSASTFGAYGPSWLYTPSLTREQWRTAPADSPFPWLRLEVGG